MFCPFCAVGLSRVGAICPACRTPLPSPGLFLAYESALALHPELATTRNRSKLDEYVAENKNHLESKNSSQSEEVYHQNEGEASKSQASNFLLVLLLILSLALGVFAFHERSIASHRYGQIASARALQNAAEKRAQSLQDQIAQQVQASQSAAAKANQMKSDLALVRQLIAGSNKAAKAGAYAQFAYDVNHTYPGFLDKTLARSCALGRPPAKADSYTQLVAPYSTSTIVIEASSFALSPAAPLAGLTAPDVVGFAGKIPEGNYYSAKVTQKDFQSGQLVSSQSYTMHFSVLNGVAYTFISWC